MSTYKELALEPRAKTPLEAMATKARQDLLEDLGALVAFDRLQALLPEIEADIEALAQSAAAAEEARGKLADQYEAERVRLVALRADLEKLPRHKRHSEKAHELQAKIKDLEHQWSETGAKLRTQQNRAAEAKYELTRAEPKLAALRAIEPPELPTLAILKQALAE